MRKSVFVILAFFVSTIGFAQQSFTVELQEITIPDLPAIHSGAFATLNDKWIFIGGRTNGLHGFHTGDGFPLMWVNNNIVVVDTATNQVWTYSADSLDDDIREAITSSNMEFYQEGNTLYMVGGYGWKSSANEFRTFPTLTAVNLPGLVNAVTTNGIITSYFRQISNDTLAVCGAHLQKLGNSYKLVFGHRFDGTYSENHTGGFFTQSYSNSVRTFNINDNGTNLSVSGFTENKDTNNFHRRDYNLVPQVFPNRQEGFTAFSGVFQKGINIPYFTTIDINPGGATHIPGFNQNLSQYHCATVPLYDSIDNNMHTLFFGGMSMYRMDTVNNQLITDSLVPFIKSISKVTRSGDSSLAEFLLPIEMPALGSNTHFIPSPLVIKYDNGVIKLNELSGRTLVGHIVGGIESPDPNIADDPTLSEASHRVFEVYIEASPVGIAEQKVVDPATLSLYPNPASDLLNISISAGKKENIQVLLLNGNGKIIAEYVAIKGFMGKTTISKNISSLSAGLYYVLLQTDKFSRVQRLVVR